MTRRNDNGAVEKLSQLLTSQHLRQLKFVGVVTVMTLLCGIFLWYLFAPKPAPQQAGAGGYNVTIPEATVKPAETDKRKVYEQEQYEQQRREKLQSLGDVMDDRLPVTGEMADVTAPAAPTAIDESDAAYRRISGEMAAFYTPAPSCDNTEVEALKEQVAALQSQLDAERQQPDPLELAEEQYKLARKYLGGGTAADEEAGPPKQRRDSRLSVMRPVREGEVEASTLDPRADFAVERNLGFLTAAGGVAHADTPTVRACVASTQVIRAGSTVQLRLLEAVRIDGVTIPRNTPLYSLATISGMRLQVVVSSVEYGGRSRSLRPRRPAGAERPELPRADGPQRGAGIRRADCRHERKRHPFGRTADVVRTGARRIAGFVAVCRREAPRGEDNPQSQPSAIIDFKTAVK